MKTQLFISLLAVLVFSHIGFACSINPETRDISSTIKAKDIVTLAIGNEAKTITRIGSLDTKKPKQQRIDIDVGTIIQKNIGNNAVSCLQLPTIDKNCN